MQIGPDDVFSRGFCVESLARPLLQPVGRPTIVLLLDRRLEGSGIWKLVDKPLCTVGKLFFIEESGLLSQDTILKGCVL